MVLTAVLASAAPSKRLGAPETLAGLAGSGADLDLAVPAGVPTTLWPLAVVRLLDLAVADSHGDRSSGSGPQDAACCDEPSDSSDRARRAKGPAGRARRNLSAWALIALLAGPAAALQEAATAVSAPQTDPAAAPETSETSNEDRQRAWLESRADQPGGTRPWRGRDGRVDSTGAGATGPGTEDGAVPDAPPLPDPDPDPGQTAGAPRPTNPTHQRFTDLLKDVLAYELEVQAFEWSQPLAREKVRDLTGHRRKRRLRLTEDKLSFRDNARQIPLAPLDLPSPNQAAELNRKVLALVSRLRRAYDESRDTRPLTLWREANEKFVSTGDWAQRDRGVTLRDEVIQRELDYARLAVQAEDLLSGNANREVIEELTVTLDAISPDTSEAGGGDLSMLTLFNETVRGQVLSELVSVLQTPVELWDEAPEAEELDLDLDVLRAKLYTASGIDQVVLEWIKLQPEIDRLQDRLTGPELIEPEDRTALVGQRTKLLADSVALERRWENARPDKELSADLILAQDAAISRQLLDAGYHGALYTTRVSHMDTLAWRVDNGSMSVWEFLAKQQELLEDIAEAVPAGSPLKGITPPPSPAELVANSLLIQRANNKIARAVQLSKQGSAGAAGGMGGGMGAGMGGGKAGKGGGMGAKAGGTGKGGGMGAGGAQIPPPILGGGKKKGQKKGKKSGYPF